MLTRKLVISTLSTAELVIGLSVVTGALVVGGVVVVVIVLSVCVWLLEAGCSVVIGELVSDGGLSISGGWVGTGVVCGWEHAETSHIKAVMTDNPTPATRFLHLAIPPPLLTSLGHAMPFGL